jgi:ubiquitin-activating enzyme E1
LVDELKKESTITGVKE